jgi:hypothetical protein
MEEKLSLRDRSMITIAALFSAGQYGNEPYVILHGYASLSDRQEDYEGSATIEKTLKQDDHPAKYWCLLPKIVGAIWEQHVKTDWTE